MKRKWKALASLCLALALMLCLSLPVWAVGEPAITEESKGNITVTGAEEGVTVYVYRLMTVNVDPASDQPKDPVYTWVEPVATWLKGEGRAYGKYISSNEDDNSVTDEFSKPETDAAAKAAEIAAFYDALAAAIRGGDIKDLTATKTAPVTSDGTCTISDLDMGNYLVLIEGGMEVYRPSAVNLVPEWKNVAAEGAPADMQWVMSDAKVELKHSPATITKTVTDNNLSNSQPSEWAQVAIGDTVTYTLVADLPQFPENAINKGYQISDSLPDGIELVATSVQVYGVAGSAEYKLEPAIDYTLNTMDPARPNGETTEIDLSIVFTNITALYTTGNYTKIKVTYDATITSAIQIVDNSNTESPIGANVNTAYLDYNNNPYEAGDDPTWETDSDFATVYTYGIKVTKVDSTDDSPLSDAEFTLHKAGNDGQPTGSEIQFIGSNGTYRVAKADENGSDETLAVDSNGELTISGLDVDTYILTETKAPGGYVLPSSGVTVTITDGKDNGADSDAAQTPDGIIDDEADATEEEKHSSGYVSLQVKNHQGFTLPTTGGMGTVLFTAAGIALMGLGLAALVLYLRRRSDK